MLAGARYGHAFEGAAGLEDGPVSRQYPAHRTDRQAAQRSGSAKPMPRWKRCSSTVNANSRPQSTHLSVRSSITHLTMSEIVPIPGLR
jgi:hypothetical protein